MARSGYLLLCERYTLKIDLESPLKHWLFQIECCMVCANRFIKKTLVGDTFVLKRNKAMLIVGCRSGLAFLAFLNVIIVLLFNGCTVIKTDTQPAPAGSISVSGNASNGNIVLRNVTITLSGDSASKDVATDSNGNFSFTGVVPGNYTLTPKKTGWDFSPAVYRLSANGSAISSQNFIGIAGIGYKADPWGNIWDTTARLAASLANAQKACSDIGGRLPTPTEIWRNAKVTGNGCLSDSSEGSWLWTNIQWNASNQVIVKLSDGSITYGAKTAGPYSFRCIWPNVSAEIFEGGNINGPAGSESFSMTINGVEYLIDKNDRCPLPWDAAVRECEFYGGFLPSESFYAVAIQAGLPNGSNIWLNTSDKEGYNGTNFLQGIVKWTGTNSAFDMADTAQSNWAYQEDITTRFRCAATKTKFPVSPLAISSGRFDSPKLSLTSTTSNYVSALSALAAIDYCFENGGHLPTISDYHGLIAAGMPTGTNTWLLTSDFQMGNYIGIIKWSGMEIAFDAMYPTYATWADPTTANSFRVVYFPLNMAYLGPSVSNCQGGRFEYTNDLGNGNVSKVWADNEDRTVDTLKTALKICHDLGGHLASKRDLVELIRHGLPNGSYNWLLTSDSASNTSIEVVRWTGLGSKASFANTWGTQDYEILKSTTAKYPFRCIWTNEVRVK